jgi:membrane protein YdbS with pleckstrin-like domain
MNSHFKTYLAAMGLLYISHAVYGYITFDVSGEPWWSGILWFMFCAVFTAIALGLIKYWWKSK